jgi:hypothetical protein
MDNSVNLLKFVAQLTHVSLVRTVVTAGMTSCCFGSKLKAGIF